MIIISHRAFYRHSITIWSSRNACGYELWMTTNQWTFRFAGQLHPDKDNNLVSKEIRSASSRSRATRTSSTRSCAATSTDKFSPGGAESYYNYDMNKQSYKFSFSSLHSSACARRSRSGVVVAPPSRRRSQWGMMRLETLIELKCLISSFSSFLFLSKLDKQFSVERFDAAVSQPTVSSPPLGRAAAAPTRGGRRRSFRVGPISLLTLSPTKIAWLKLSGKIPYGPGNSTP